MADSERAHSATVGDKGRLTLPDDVRRFLGIEGGGVVIIELTDKGTAEIIPATVVPRDQLWFAHEDMHERVQEALSDIREGRTTRVRTPAEMREYLARLGGDSPSD